MLDFLNIDIAGQEIRYAREERDKLLSNYQQMLKHYTSGFWKNSQGYDDATDLGEFPENVYFEFQALMKPRLAQNVPQAITETARSTKQAQEITIASKHAMNKWYKDTKYNLLMGQSCTDFGFNFSALHVSMTENQFMGGDGKLVNRKWPEVNRVSQKDYWCDPLAKAYDLVRYEGHDELIDKDDLLERAEQENKDDASEWGEWDLDAIEGVAAGDGSAVDEMGAPLRNQVLLTTVWVRGYEDEKHPGEEERYYGTVFTFCSSVDADEHDLHLVHDPEPFFGPPDGPYCMESPYAVPDSPYGVSSLTANEGPIRDLNKHARGVSRSQSRHKRGVAVDSTDPNFAEAVRDFEDHAVLEMAGLTRDAIVPIEINGASAEAVGYLQLAKERSDRSLGLSEAMRGVAQGDKTATESALASQGGDVRTAGYQDAFFRLHNSVSRKVLWYMLVSEDFQDILTPEAVEELGGQEGEVIYFQGGLDSDDPDEMRPEDLDITIEVASVAHVTPAVKQQRAQVGHQILSETAQIALAAPFVKAKQHLELMGEAFGMPHLAELWDQELYEMFMARQLQMEFQQAEGPDQKARLESHPGGPDKEAQPVGLPFQGARESLFGAPQQAGQSAGAQMGAQAQQTAQPGPGGF